MKENMKENMKEINIEMVDNLPRLSYSRLSDFDQKGPIALVKRTVLASEGVRFGSLVDVLISDPARFNKEFIISATLPLAGGLKPLGEYIKKNYTEIPSELEVLKLIKKLELWKNIKDVEKLKVKLNQNFWNTLKTFITHKDKSVVDLELYGDAQDCVTALKTHFFTKHIFSKDAIYQFKFEFEYLNTILRGIVDIVQIDHSKKTIRLLDLKTGSGNYKEFNKSFIKYRYYLQACIYMLAIDTIKQALNIQNYKALPFIFVYIGRTQKLPVLYEYDSKWLKFATKGFNINGYKYRGLNKLIEEVKWHLAKQEFRLSKDILESHGVIKLENNTLTDYV